MDVVVTNLTKRFGAVRANDGVTLRFAAGQIHGVLGENGAGKSTLMKLISGFIRPDAGTISLGGSSLALRGPGDALRAGVGMVHQDPLDLPGFTALENLICAAPRGALPSLAAARQALRELASRLNFALDADAPVAALTVGQRQQLEIVRLLACGANALILDEPTTGITAAQARSLFAALRQLASEGRTVLFVSHKLDEVAELCDTVSVLRAGRLVGEQLTMPIPQRTLLELMFGPSADGERAAPVQRVQPTSTQPAWQLERVTARDGAVALRGLSLELPAGRVVGLAGLEGSGQQILLRLLAGRARPDAGRILVAGHDLTAASARAYRAAGVEYLPADRLRDGVVGPLSLADHYALLGRGPVVDRRAAVQQAEAAISAYGIKATADKPIAALSGGNQQRAMLALIPDATSGLLCEQPTRGLDVASARAIWRRILERRDAGCGVVFASADLDELLTYSDELLVFFGGRVSSLLPRSALNERRLAELIGGVGFGSD